MTSTSGKLVLSSQYKMPVDHENDLVLVTCASGKQCAHLVPLLYGKWKRLRLVFNSAASEERLKKQYPDAEVTRADLENINECRRVMSGVTTVYHVGPSMHPHETEIGYFMVDAASEEAEEGSFKHFVYSSVLNTQIRKMMNHDGKRYVEEYLIESDVNYTFLKPTNFMDMFPIGKLMSEENPVYRSNNNLGVASSFIALRDLAEAGAKVIGERERHYLAEYPLCSTHPTTYSDFVSIVGKEMGKEVKVEQKPVMEAADDLLTLMHGGPDKAHPRARDGMQRLILFYTYRGLRGNPNVLEWLLGRKPTSIQEWAQARISEG